jgi:hypothetical protein
MTAFLGPLSCLAQDHFHPCNPTPRLPAAHSSPCGADAWDPCLGLLTPPALIRWPTGGAASSGVTSSSLGSPHAMNLRFGRGQEQTRRVSLNDLSSISTRWYKHPPEPYLASFIRHRSSKLVGTVGGIQREL